MSLIKLACPCLFGVESLVADELRQLGYPGVYPQNGLVVFDGDEAAVARANINLRCAERVLVLLGRFEAKTFDQLFENVKSLPWEQWIGRENAFPVKGWSLNSTLHSVPDCQAIIKKAAVERLKIKYKTEWFKETGPKMQIQFSILKDDVSVYLDTSGEGLHKRGYRAVSNAAPLKETLAAAMVKLSRYAPSCAFCDPFCGSGTILIEAALIGTHTAPGLSRGFSAEKWASLPAGIWAEARAEATGKIIREPFTVAGFDVDPSAVALTLENARKAGVGSFVSAKAQDIRDFAPAEPRGIVVCNPPYGERMLEISQAEQIYRLMGQAFLRLPGWNYYVICASERFESLFGRKADKKRKLYNGMIKCDLYQYFRHHRPLEKKALES